MCVCVGVWVGREVNSRTQTRCDRQSCQILLQLLPVLISVMSYPIFCRLNYFLLSLSLSLCLSFLFSSAFQLYFIYRSIEFIRSFQSFSFSISLLLFVFSFTLYFVFPLKIISNLYQFSHSAIIQTPYQFINWSIDLSIRPSADTLATLKQFLPAENQ